jgi:hypothetical protein
MYVSVENPIEIVFVRFVFCWQLAFESGKIAKVFFWFAK